MAALRRRDLARVFLRSLWLQASWSFEGMQSLGFAYAVAPALERLHGAGEGDAQARARHLEFFNTHPFLAAAILGCVVRMEERGEPAAEVLRAKGALMGAYGAIGDSFYWGGLKLVLSVAAVWLLSLGWTGAPWAFLALFTAGNLVGRLFFFVQGYRGGPAIVGTVNRLNLILWSKRLKDASALLLGLLLVGLAGFAPRAGAAGLLVPALALGFTGALAWLFRNGLNPLWAAYGTAVLAAAALVWT